MHLIIDEFIGSIGLLVVLGYFIAMICPNCSEILQKIEVTATSGGRFEVEHCGRCGGTWFDPYEINRIPYHEVVRLAKLTVIAKNIAGTAEKLLCPRCHREMENYKSEAVPANVKLFWCRKCLGIWASQKDIWEFKKNQEKTIDSYKTDNEKIFPQLSVVFIPAVAVLILFLTTFITIGKLSESRESRIQATNMISNLQIIPISTSSVSLTFNTQTPVKSYVSYGISTLELEILSIRDSLSVEHGIILTELLPGKNYFYTISFEDENGRKFTTPVSLLTTK